MCVCRVKYTAETILLNPFDPEDNARAQFLCVPVFLLQTQAPQVVTIISDFWQPEPWFVAVVTVTGGLLVLVLGLLIWTILRRYSCDSTQTYTFTPAHMHTEREGLSV